MATYANVTGRVTGRICNAGNTTFQVPDKLSQNVGCLYNIQCLFNLACDQLTRAFDRILIDKPSNGLCTSLLHSPACN